MPLIVTVHRGLITNDSLYDLQAVLQRNFAGAGLEMGNCTRSMLDTAVKYLRNSNVFVATFKDGTVVHFVGVVPAGLTVEGLSRAVSR